VLVNCRQDMEIMRKEIFGPALPVNVVENLDVDEILDLLEPCLVD
jgi:lactaldehyde dehydrogenase/glycolaldehyde dehydrogenase